METPGSANRIPARFSTLAPRWIGPVGILMALVAALLLPTSSAIAADFPVTNTNDNGAGSLRGAIEAANTALGPDSIPISATGTINLETALPDIADQVEIVGPGQDLLTVRRNSPAEFSVFQTDGVVSISGLTISNGLSPAGGGIGNTGSLTLTRVRVSGNDVLADSKFVSVASGGGIFSLGPSLTLREVSVTGNQVTASNGTVGTDASGGGVFAGGVLEVTDSTISGNSADTVGGEAPRTLGAGLFFFGNTATIERSTISGNSAHAGNGGTAIARGGGISSDKGVMRIIGSTITGNSASSSAAQSGGNLDLPPTTMIGDTIISASRETSSCTGPLTSQGFNIDDGTSCGLTQPSDLSSTNPGIDPNLAENGGPTPTHALLPGSVAIDRGNAFGATTDQRGRPRPSDFLAVPNRAGGDGSDVGAFEAQAPPRDTKAPNTRIRHRPPHRTRNRLAVFRFSSTEAGSRFQCKLDQGQFRGCRSPFKRRVKAGPGRGRRHVFLVRAIDRAGNVDRTPARFVWRVILPG